MTYKAQDFDWSVTPAKAISPKVYFNFHPQIDVNGTTFLYDRKDIDDDFWVTAIYYKAQDGREIVAYQNKQ